MSRELVPSSPAAAAIAAVQANAGMTSGAPGPGATPPRPPRWPRYRAALLRYRWIILAFGVAGGAVGVALTRLVPASYVVTARLWIANAAERADSTGPIRRNPVLPATAWGNLLTSYAVLDRVAERLGLYLQPKREAERPFFKDFAVTPQYLPGPYELTVGNDGRWTLERDGRVVEAGALGDSIGRTVGLRWAPADLARGSTLEFSLASVREAASMLRERLQLDFANERFVTLTLTGTSPERDAQILNALAAELTGTATTLQGQSDAELATLLGRQVAEAERALRASEQALAGFRSGAITMPTAGSLAEAQRDPTVGAFFVQRLQLDSVRNERTRVENAIATLAASGSAGSAQLLTIPSVREAPEVRALAAQLAAAEDSAQALRRTFTEEYAPLRDLRATIQRLTTEAIPAAAGNVVARLRARERELDAQLARSTGTLRGIPARAQREQELARDVEVKQGLYTALQRRYESAQMAQASTVAPMTLLDRAVAPLKPTRNTAPFLIAASLLGGLAAGIGLALLLDRRDPRVRYPEHVTQLGLPILGAVPKMKASLAAMDTDPVEAAKAFEAFRELRVALRHAQREPGPLQVTVTSPGGGEGKSLLSSNLALAFAEAGYRTLLIDGDTRRGQLNTTFGVEAAPGLTDFLAGDATPDQIARRGTHEKLLVIPAGTRLDNGPELLMSESLQRLLSAVRPLLDVIIVDAPPLGAGADAMVLGTTTRNVLMVLRAGVTDRQMAAAKLDVLDRLPVRVVGAVLNDVKPEGAFRYYAYLDGYATTGVPHVPVTPKVVGVR
ncbi:MAG TPA: polysaccharide biosynthesis tyrosine autokinase [Gemmatimonadaceae bacterium]|nr:polysaccharide biosynthesis tyrosine autokinase [Gemmatimonadaceae bacterium]